MFKIQPIIIYSALIHTKGLLDKMTPEEYLQNRPVLPEDYLPFIKNYLDGWDQGQLISSVNRYIAAGVSSGQSSADSMFKEKGICSTLANVIIFFLTRSWQVHAQSQQAAQGQIADAPPSLDYTFAAAFKKVALAHPKDVKTMGLFSFEELLCFIPDARAKDPKLQALYQQHMEQIKDLRQVNQSPKLIQLQQLALLHPKEIWRLLQLKKDFEEVINAVNQTEKRRLFYPQIVSDRLLQGGV